jgi:hypothetical protein
MNSDSVPTPNIPILVTCITSLPLITLQHAIHEISQRTPEILATIQTVLIDEEDVVLEAGIEMSLESQLANNWVVVTVDVGVHTVHPLEDLLNHAREGFGKWHT